MKEEIINKMNQLDRIEYKLEKKIIEDDYDSTSMIEHLVITGLIASSILIFLKYYSRAIIFLWVIIIGWIVVFFVMKILEKIILNKLEKKYLDKMNIKPRGK